ncbi:hypothetical protein FRC00_008436 [Tulasnella sp. 408]|nr:hypothetical protein FRC00_008436 [Tulasnella sp. 408]
MVAIATSGNVGSGFVAVKVLRKVDLNQFDDEEAYQRIILQEAITWSGLVHPNIAPLIGYTLTPTPRFISPWYEQGSLRQHLKINPNANGAKLLHSIAKALNFLHSRKPQIVHGDIKPENILIDDQNEPRITDFGMATILGEEHMRNLAVDGPGADIGETKIL